MKYFTVLFFFILLGLVVLANTGNDCTTSKCDGVWCVYKAKKLIALTYAEEKAIGIVKRCRAPKAKEAIDGTY